MTGQDHLKHWIKIQKQLNQIYTPTYIHALELAQKQNRLIENIFGSYTQYEAVARQFQIAYNIYKKYDNPTLHSALKIANSKQALAYWYDAVDYIDWEAASKENLSKIDIEKPLKSLSTVETAESLSVNNSDSQVSKLNLSNISACCNIATFIGKIINCATSQESQEKLKSIYTFFSKLAEKYYNFFND